MTWVTQEVEQFLYAEAALIDQWKLNEWMALFTEDCTYVVPSTDLPEGNPETDLVFIDDNFVRLRGRVRKMQSRQAHREVPHSRVRHFVSNVRIVSDNGADALVEANFLVYRFKEGSTEPFVGHYRYELTRQEGEIKIRHKRAVLDLETLRGQGAVSVLL